MNSNGSNTCGGNLPGASAPRVWLCASNRLGDNAQVEIAAEALGWPYERKQILFRPPWDRQKPPVSATLEYVDRAHSDALEPPWPDLLLTMGRRLSAVALWIQQQSGGRTKLVLFGKPSGQFERFDLVVPSAENPLPARPNVLPLDLPLMRIDGQALATARQRWQELASLPRPLTALFVGGPTQPFRFSESDAEQLGRSVARVVSQGTLWVATSPRTSPEVVAGLRAGLPPGTHIYRWLANDPQNPYRGLLAHADRFVVTADSISMMVEVARLGKPLSIYPLQVVRKSWRTRLRYRVAERLLTKCTAEGPRLAAEPLGDALYRRGWIRFERDFEAIHRALVRRGAALPFRADGEACFPAGGQPLPNELDDVLAAIRRLVDSMQASVPSGS